MGRKPAVNYEQYQDLVSLQDIEQYPQIIPCLDYLVLKESDEKHSMEEIALILSKKYSLPKTRQGLYYTVETWRRNGTLEKAKLIFVAPKIEEIRAAVNEAINKLPDMIRLVTADALNPERSGRQRIDAITFLAQMAQNEMVQKDSGSAEKRFAQLPQVVNPIDVPEN